VGEGDGGGEGDGEGLLGGGLLGAEAPSLTYTDILSLPVCTGPVADFMYPHTPSWVKARQSGRAEQDNCSHGNQQNKHRVSIEYQHY
jgi:hypothetical protein